ncbi:MAG: efflux RND transporter periplasmic adaptor subunit [Candidatus Eisenbacteria bacterium]
MRRKTIILMFALAAILVIAAVVIPRILSHGGPVSVTVARAEFGEITEMIVAKGNTEPVEKIDIATNLAARIVSVKVDVGDVVQKGDLLAQLDRTTYSDQMAKAIAERDNAQRTYDDALTTLRRQEDSFIRGIGTQEDVEEARRALVSAEGRLELAKIDVDIRRMELYNTSISAPIKGVVSARYVNQGEMVGEAGQVLFTIGTREISFTAYIDEEETGKLRQGQPCEVTLGAFPDRTFNGQINKINPAITDEPLITGFPIWVGLADSVNLVPGLSGYVKVKVVQPALVIPLSALTYFSANHGLVFVVEGQVARLRPVVFGGSSDRKMAIISGLEAGDRVVVEGHEDLDDGREVEILD